MSLKIKSSNDQGSIGVFDSGVGGLTVLRALQEKLPNERFIYFGDTARLPYGTKGAETIIRYASESALFLVEQNIKMLVVACNTVSAYALEYLENKFQLPVIGVIDPGVESLLEASKRYEVAVLGTSATIKSGTYERKIKHRNPNAIVHSIPCPLFVPIVEEKMGQHKLAHAIVEEYLIPLANTEIDAILLGCTHYPLLKIAIEQVLHKLFKHPVSIVDSASTCANHIKKSLEHKNLMGSMPIIKPEFFVSDDPGKFKEIANLFLSGPIDKVELVHHRENTFFKID